MILPEVEYPHQVLIPPPKWEYISTRCGCERVIYSVRAGEGEIMKKEVTKLIWLSIFILLLSESVTAQTKEGWIDWIEQTIFCGMLPLGSVQGGNRDIQQASINISANIDAQSGLGKLFLSQNLSLKIIKCTFYSPNEMARIYSDKVTYSLGQNWVAPFTIEIEGNKQPPQVSFKNGEIVWNKNKTPPITIKEGTLSKIKDDIYVFKNKKWQLK